MTIETDRSASANEVALNTQGSQAGSTAVWNASHPLTRHFEAVIQAPGSARISMAIGELASSIDHAARVNPVAVGVSAIKANQYLGITAVSLAALWGKWGRPTCLIDLGSGTKLLSGAISSARPDLGDACRMNDNGGLNGLAAIHSGLPNCALIAAGSADVLGLLSTGQLTNLTNSLKKRFDRIVIAAPPVDTSFPFLALYKCCDRLVLSLRRGKTRGGAVRELAEQGMALGMRPLDAIWFE